jgi:programmed cell death protein 4
LSGLRDERTVTEDDFLWGFSHLLGSLPDLTIDCPNAVELVSKFLIRATTDEVLPPSFLENAVRLGLGAEEGMASARIAKTAVENTEVEWADLRNVWGKLGSAENKKWRNELDVALREYFDSHDKAEFCRIMHDWALCTSRAITVTKEAILKAMDGNGNDCMAVVDLIEYAVKHEELKQSDVLRAMSEIDSTIPDLRLDIPDVQDMVDTFGGLLRARGILPLASPRSSAASVGSR